MFTFQTEALSSPGGRKYNEDACGHEVLENFACWVLADGLGGHGGGATAAKLAVASILDAFKRRPACTPDGLTDYFQTAEEEIRKKQREEGRLAQMRTTAVIAISDFRSIIWGHIGDSRLYYFRTGRIDSQTRDHSVPQALCNAGEIKPADIRFHEDRNRLLRALGANERCEPSIEKAPRSLEASDALLLCSDGFWEYVIESEMEDDRRAADNPKEWLRRMETRLVQRARGEHDNYSAVAVFVGPKRQ